MYFLLFVFITVLSFFLVNKRSIFFVTLLGATIYFFPLGLPDPEHLEIVPIAFAYYLLFVFFVIIFSWLPHSDMSGTRHTNNSLYKELLTSFCRFLSIISIILLCWVLINYGIFEFFAPKTEQRKSSILSQLISMSTVLGFATSLVVERKRYLIFFIAMLMITFIGGSRTHIVISLFIFLIHFLNGSDKNYKHLFNRWSVFFAVLILFIGTVGKYIYARVSLYFMGVPSDHYDDINVIKMFSSTEPFHVTHGIFFRCVSGAIKVSPDYLVYFPLEILPIAQLTGVSYQHAFSEAVKSQFFSGWSESTGVGASFLGEGIALFGLFGFIFFSLAILSLTYVTRILMQRHKLFYLVGLVMLSYMVFYVHRNSLFQLVGHLTKYLYFYAFCMIIVTVFLYLNRSLRK